MGAVKTSCVSFLSTQEVLPAHGAPAITAIYPEGQGLHQSVSSKLNSKCCVDSSAGCKPDLQPADITTNYRTNQKSRTNRKFFRTASSYT